MRMMHTRMARRGLEQLYPGVPQIVNKGLHSWEKDRVFVAFWLSFGQKYSSYLGCLRHYHIHQTYLISFTLFKPG